MPQQDEPIVIKKYANRRLYNTATSAYIVIADIIKMVEDDVDFVVLDAKSGQDLTRAILNQVIFEQESQGSGFMFPLEFQRQLIRLYSDNCRALLPDYLAQSLNYFNDQRDSMGQAMQEAMAHNTNAMMEFSRAMARQNLSYYQHSMDMFRAFTSMGAQAGADSATGAGSMGANRAGRGPSENASNPGSQNPDSQAPVSRNPGTSPSKRASTKRAPSKSAPSKDPKPGQSAPSASTDNEPDQDIDAIKAQLLALQKQINDLSS